MRKITLVRQKSSLSPRQKSNVEMLNRLRDNWVYGSFLASILLLAMTPHLSEDWPLDLILIWIQLPIYMLHQYEEHDNDKFRRFVNENIGGGNEVLSLWDVFIINIFGVWGVDLVSFVLAKNGHIGFGLIAVYLSLVNGVGHTIQAILQKKYNPGLITSLLLFLPNGVITVKIFANTPAVNHLDHYIGLATSLLLHAAIVVRVVTRKRRFL